MSEREQKIRKSMGRRLRVRQRVSGTARRPRLSVHKGVRNIAAQLIDDESGRVLAAASSFAKEVKGKLKNGGNVQAAAEVGKLIAAKAQKLGISAVVFDRGSSKYHGRVKALAEAARAGGLKF